MKHIFKTIIAATVLTGFVSCEDFLEASDPNNITTDSFWQNESDALEGVMAAYGVLQYKYVMGAQESAIATVRTDLARSSIWENTPLSLQNFTYNDSNTYLTYKWNQLYIGVFRANQVLYYLPNIDMDEDAKATITAEAHFLRGLYYFWLMNTFNEGSVPMPITFPESIDEYNLPLSEKSEVYALIESDFKAAIESGALPEKWDDSNLGRATWGAAVGLLGQLYLYEGHYDLAAVEFKKLIDRPDIYSLVEEIGWNFDIAHEWNSESIFEVNFSAVVSPETHSDKYDSTTASEATGRPNQFASGQFGGWLVVLPSAWAREIFEADILDPDKPGNVGRSYTKRCEASIYIRDADYDFYKLDDGDAVTFNNVSANAYVKKFQNWDGNTTEDITYCRSGINERVMRLADVYLMYAEAIVQRDGDSAAAEAVTYINYVRDRSDVKHIDVADYSTKDKIMNHLMYVERPLELAYEGHSIRWNDLRRWGIIKEWYTTLSNRTFYFPQYDDAVAFQEFDNSATNFTDANYYLPMPNDEVTKNPYIEE